MNTLSRLSDWYLHQCDGDWEHSFGFQIGTLDNPGILIDIDLVDTDLEGVAFEEVRDNHTSKSDWFICKRTATKFEARGAASRFEDILIIFLDWAEKNTIQTEQDAAANPYHAR